MTFFLTTLSYLTHFGTYKNSAHVFCELRENGRPPWVHQVKSWEKLLNCKMQGKDATGFGVHMSNVGRSEAIRQMQIRDFKLLTNFCCQLWNKFVELLILYILIWGEKRWLCEFSHSPVHCNWRLGPLCTWIGMGWVTEQAETFPYFTAQKKFKVLLGWIYSVGHGLVLLLSAITGLNFGFEVDILGSSYFVLTPHQPGS